MGDGRRIGARQLSANRRGGGEKSAGFFKVALFHILQGDLGRRGFRAGEVAFLTAGQPFDADGLRQMLKRFQARIRRGAIFSGDKPVGFIKKRNGGEHRRALAKNHMRRKTSPPQFRVIHGWQIIHDQRRRMDHLYSACRIDRHIRRPAGLFTSKKRDQGPDAFARRQKAMANRTFKARFAGP